MYWVASNIVWKNRAGCCPIALQARVKMIPLQRTTICIAMARFMEQIGDLAALTVEERMKYDASINAYRTQLAVESYEREQRKIEREKGREEGREEGIQETARKLKQMGMSAEFIAEATGLCLDVIEKL